MFRRTIDDRIDEINYGQVPFVKSQVEGEQFVVVEPPLQEEPSTSKLAVQNDLAALALELDRAATEAVEIAADQPGINVF